MARAYLHAAAWMSAVGWSMLGIAPLNAASISWDAGGAGNQNWSQFTNFSDDASPVGDIVTFDNTGSTATADTTTNIVDSSVSVGGLAYTNSGATNTHTTQINSGVTLSVVAGAGPFSVSSSGVTKVNFTGAGTLLVTNVNQNFGNVTNGTTVVDMSQLGTFSTSGGSFFVGPGFAAATTISMASTNFWQVGKFRITNTIANGNSFKFGQTNTIRINSDDFQLGSGGSSSGNTIGFRAGLSGTPTLLIRDFAGNGRTVGGMYIGQQSTNSSSGTSVVMDLTASGGFDGTIDARLASLVVGDKADSINNNTAGTGTFIYDQGTVDALTVTLGRIVSAGVNAAAASNGTLTLGGTGLLVADTIKLGDNAGSGASTASGTLNVSGGTVQATDVQPGAGSGTRTLNFNSGKIQNKTSTNLTIASGVIFNSLTSGTHTFEADSGQSITVNSALVGAGTGDVVKAGLGTLNFNVANTYAGNTVISAGTLALGSSGSLTSPSISVAGGATYDVSAVGGGYSLNNGQTLKGTGTITGGLTAAVGSTIAPGNSVGTLTMGAVSLADGALFNFELATTGASDRVSMTAGTLTLNNQEFADFTFTPLGGFGPGTYVLFDANAVSGSLGGSVSGTIGGYSAALAVQGSDLVLNVIAPEPGSAMLLLAGIGATSLRRRRKA